MMHPETSGVVHLPSIFKYESEHVTAQFLYSWTQWNSFSIERKFYETNIVNAKSDLGTNEELTEKIEKYIERLLLKIDELTVKELEAELLMSEINPTWNSIRAEEKEAQRALDETKVDDAIIEEL